MTEEAFADLSWKAAFADLSRKPDHASVAFQVRISKSLRLVVPPRAIYPPPLQSGFAKADLERHTAPVDAVTVGESNSRRTSGSGSRSCSGCLSLFLAPQH